MDDAGKIIGSSAIAKDFTKEKEIDKAKSEFVSLAAHQLRSPLTTINWYSEILLGNELGQVSEKQKEYLEEINKSSRRMSELVNAFLSASRIDLGTFAINPQPMKLSEEINKSIDELEEKITKKKIIINKSIDENIPEINADPALVRIIMGNLISNSVKYSPEGSLVDVSATKDDKFINIKVSDHGCGIPQSQKDKIFGRLFRADNAAQIDPDGNGLGLYIVKSIIDKIKGKIRFESEEGKGTDFYVSLPLLGMPKIEGAKGLK